MYTHGSRRSRAPAAISSSSNCDKCGGLLGARGLHNGDSTKLPKNSAYRAGGRWSTKRPSMLLPKNSFGSISAKHRPGTNFLARRSAGAPTGRAAGWFAFPQNNTHLTSAESIASRRTLHAQLIKTALPRLRPLEILRRGRNRQVNANST